MQEKSTQIEGFGPLGICHRLFNFIMNTILTRGTRRATLVKSDTTTPQHDETRPFEANHMGHVQVTRPESNELPVEFRHTNGSMVNRKGSTSGQVLVQEKRNSTQTRKEMESQDKGKGNGGSENTTKKRTLTIVEGAKLHGRRPHLLSVASNINEKADAFIRSRKEAMQKALTMKQTNDE